MSDLRELSALAEFSGESHRVLVTGAGGPAAVAVLRSLVDRADVHLLAADMDPYASGLFLVAAEDRFLVPAGRAPGFADALLALARAHDVRVIVPTVDDELLPLARMRSEFEEAGITMVLPSEQSLAACLDKVALAEACAGLEVPRTELLSEATDADSWNYPVIVKPRRGSGSRGVRTVDCADELRAIVPDGDLMVQAFLPGEEYSVDVCADARGRVIAAVPRTRLRMDSGVSIAGRTVVSPALSALARRVVARLGLSYVVNVQLRRDANGVPHLLEVNPRFPGSMPLTVASGVDMPSLAIDAALGRFLPIEVPHREMLMVRYLTEVFVEEADGGQLPLALP